jgi:hypothetical protein
MTAHQIIRDALAIRLRKPAPSVQCACCKAMLDPEDFRPDLFADATEIEAWFCGAVCTGCMDDHVRAEDTGAWINRDEAWRDDDGGYWQHPTPGGYEPSYDRDRFA